MTEPRTLLSLLALLTLWSIAAQGQEAPAAGQPAPLRAALDELSAQGVDLIYSEAVVRRWMTARPEAPEGPPAARLEALLAPYDLVAVRGGNDVWLVTRKPEAEANTGTFFGRVVNEGVPVTGVNVTLIGTNRVATTDEGGRFAIDDIAPGAYAVRATAYGYTQPAPAAIEISPGQPRWLELDVTPVPLTLDQVAVVASKYRLLSSRVSPSLFLTREEVDRLPHLGDDVHRAIKLLPGTAGNDFSGRVNLRGGVADETAVRLDGLELIDPFHLKDLGGGLGSIDSELIRGVDLISGGFGADLGNASSGFVDARTLEPTGEPETSVGVSFINAFARSQGGFDNGNGGWLVSLRRGYLDLLLDQVKTGADEIQPRYWDFLSKVDYRLSDRLAITANAFVTQDDTKVRDDDMEDWKNETKSYYFWVNAEMDPTSLLHGELTASTGTVNEDREAFTSDAFGDAADTDDQLDLWFTGLRTDWTWLAGERSLFRLGAEARYLEADYDYDLVGSTFNIFSADRLLQFDRHIHESYDGEELSSWGAWRFQPVDPLTVELGLRWDQQTYTDLSNDEQVSPRVNLAWQLSENTRLRGAWGYFYQPQRINELNVEDGEDFFHRAQRAEHRVFGIDHAFGDGYSVRADFYQKKYTDVIPRYENLFDPLELPPEAQSDRIRIAPNRAEARGVELSLRGRWGERIDWWGSYTWSKVDDHIDGRDELRSWDQRHATSVGVKWVGERWDWSFVHSYHSGWPRTGATFETVQDADGNDVVVIVPNRRNSDNFEAYHRLDMRVSRRVTLPRGMLRYYFELYNVYDRKNECCIERFRVIDDGSGPELTTRTETWLPIIPSFGVSYTFR